MRGLLDTSVFIAGEQDRALGPLPDEAAISVMTVAELHVGVLVAKDEPTRAQRLRTLAEVERTFDPLPVDDQVARRFAEIVAAARRQSRRPKVGDSFIAATAMEHGLMLFTQDDDFNAIPGLKVARV